MEDSRTATVGQKRPFDESSLNGESSSKPSPSARKRASKRRRRVAGKEAVRDFVPPGGSFVAAGDVLTASAESGNDHDDSEDEGEIREDGRSTDQASGTAKGYDGGVLLSSQTQNAPPSQSPNALPNQSPNVSGIPPSVNWNAGTRAKIRTTLGGGKAVAKSAQALSQQAEVKPTEETEAKTSSVPGISAEEIRTSSASPTSPTSPISSQVIPSPDNQSNELASKPLHNIEALFSKGVEVRKLKKTITRALKQRQCIRLSPLPGALRRADKRAHWNSAPELRRCFYELVARSGKAGLAGVYHGPTYLIARYNTPEEAEAALVSLAEAELVFQDERIGKDVHWLDKKTSKAADGEARDEPDGDGLDAASFDESINGLKSDPNGSNDDDKDLLLNLDRPADALVGVAQNGNGSVNGAASISSRSTEQPRTTRSDNKDARQSEDEEDDAMLTMYSQSNPAANMEHEPPHPPEPLEYEPKEEHARLPDDAPCVSDPKISSSSSATAAGPQTSSSSTALPPLSPTTKIATRLVDLPPTALALQSRYLAPTAPSEFQTLTSADRPPGIADLSTSSQVHHADELATCLICLTKGHTAAYCPSLVCSRCGAYDTHHQSACPLQKRCPRCRQQGHGLPNCPSKLALSAKAGDLVRCDLCGKDGHVEDVCSLIWRTYPTTQEQAPRKMASRDMVVACYACGSAGHFGVDCRMRSRTKVLASGGLTFSLSNMRRYLRDDDELVGRAGSGGGGGGGGMAIKGRANMSSTSGLNQPPRQPYQQQPGQLSQRISSGPRSSHRSTRHDDYNDAEDDNDDDDDDSPAHFFGNKINPGRASLINPASSTTSTPSVSNSAAQGKGKGHIKFNTASLGRSGPLRAASEDYSPPPPLQPPLPNEPVPPTSLARGGRGGGGRGGRGARGGRGGDRGRGGGGGGGGDRSRTRGGGGRIEKPSRGGGARGARGSGSGSGRGGGGQGGKYTPMPSSAQNAWARHRV
ncbi:MAG: hypothetical protein M1819_006531 [Sarea resinae]|nr:MAG: hypothetical protein M1819_006531 [Sarea resinae]